MFYADTCDQPEHILWTKMQKLKNKNISAIIIYEHIDT